MSKATEASSIRRLAGIFNPSLSSTTNSTTSTISNPRKKAINFQKIVKNFKKSCESEEFRKNDQKTYAFTVRRLASAGQFSLIDDILQHQKKYQEISQEGFINRLMLLYSYAGMFDQAQKLFDEMPELKCDRTVRSFNTLLSACIRSNRLDEVEKLLNHLPDKVGLKPDLVSYNTLIKAYCEMGSLDTALSMIDTLEMKGLEPNIITFGTLIDALFKKGRMADGEKIWELMEKNNVVPDIWIYNLKLKGLVYGNKISEAIEWWEKMKSEGFEPDVHSYNIWIEGFCNQGNIEQVKKWYSELKETGISPNQFTYFMLVHFFCEKYEFEMAVELCKEAINSRIFTGYKLLQTVVNELVKDSRIDEAVQLVELSNSLCRFKLTLPRS